MNVSCCVRNTIPIKRAITHAHNELEVIVHLEGAAISLIGSKSYEVGPKSVIVIPPNTYHGGYALEDTFTDMYMQLKNVGFKTEFVFTDTDSSIETLMNMINKVLTEKEENYQAIADSLAEALCQYLKKLSNTALKFPFVNEFKNEIYDNLTNTEFNITEEIKKYGFNIDYFRRCFKKEVGASPLEYITDLRLNRAKTMLLQETFVSIEDVAHSCGFNDSFYFSTCFKKHNGISPLQYRKSKLN